MSDLEEIYFVAAWLSSVTSLSDLRRPLTRAKNAKKAAGATLSSAERKQQDGMSVAQRAERDAKALKEKQAAKAAAAGS